MNLAQIDAEIVERLKNCRSQDELREIQAWAKKAKNTKEIIPTVSEFIRIYYNYEVRHRGGSGSRARWTTVETFDKTAFVLMGFEVKLPKGEYEFPETEFDSKKIFIDRKIKWGGKSYYPKIKSTSFFGIDMLQLFWDELKKENYCIFIGHKSAYLTNRPEVLRRLESRQRPLQHHIGSSQLVKIPKALISFFEGKIAIKKSQWI